MLVKDLGEAIKDRRKELDITQPKLAKVLGMELTFHVKMKP